LIRKRIRRLETCIAGAAEATGNDEAAWSAPDQRNTLVSRSPLPAGKPVWQTGNRKTPVLARKMDKR
jgi:hypothetical protein